ncbi:hypothetical protein BDZ45DRAFT_679467 [Acephala macrosclerotiorum]|nr:hypothetical protein BDZ45DRAFT_679467 [Acephala macrosclerotiorum]
MHECASARVRWDRISPHFSGRTQYISNRAAFARSIFPLLRASDTFVFGSINRAQSDQMPVVTRDGSRRTSDPEQCRPARLLVVSFNGTWAGALWNPRSTVVPAFVDCIDADCENVVEIPVNGVGVDGSWMDYVMGGIGGYGTLRNVVNALKNLSKSYRPQDRIILVGYSRGAWAARYLAYLISFIGGLPKADADETLWCRIFKACDNKIIWEDGVAEKLMVGYDCYRDVRINSLCCFDTVGSLGLLLTGIAKPLDFLRRWWKKHDVISDVAPNVDFAFHALALHEKREPFAATLMRGNNTFQVSFPGTHGDLGWIEDRIGLVHAPLAWMIQQNYTKLNIKFDERKLEKRFPNYRRYGAADPDTEPIWYKSPMKGVSSAILAIVGTKVRKPGRINCAGGHTNLKVHIGARLRKVHGASEDEDAVPGYGLATSSEGIPFWERTESRGIWPRSRSPRTGTNISSPSTSTSTSGSSSCAPVRRATSSADRIDEAPVGDLEAMCLGLPKCYVTSSR